MSKKGRQIGVRVDDDTGKRLDQLAKDHPIGSVSSFAAEAIKRGLPSLEAEYGKRKEDAAKNAKAA